MDEFGYHVNLNQLFLDYFGGIVQLTKQEVFL
jgi:hypothetical protein